MRHARDEHRHRERRAARAGTRAPAEREHDRGADDRAADADRLLDAGWRRARRRSSRREPTAKTTPIATDDMCSVRDGVERARSRTRCCAKKFEVPVQTAIGAQVADARRRRAGPPSARGRILGCGAPSARSGSASRWRIASMNARRDDEAHGVDDDRVRRGDARRSARRDMLGPATCATETRQLRASSCRRRGARGRRARGGTTGTRRRRRR